MTEAGVCREAQGGVRDAMIRATSFLAILLLCAPGDRPSSDLDGSSHGAGAEYACWTNSRGRDRRETTERAASARSVWRRCVAKVAVLIDGKPRSTGA